MTSNASIALGAAPVSWGIWFPDDDRQLPWRQCLDEISQVGFEWIELGPYGYLPTDREVLQRELSHRKLRVSGTFAMGPMEDLDQWPPLEAEVVSACESLVAVKANYIILIDGTYSDLFTGELLREPVLTEDEWRNLIEATHRMAGIASNRFGLRAVFHPHAETHVETEEQIQRFLADTDPDLVGLCLDTGHHAYRGGDPVEFVRANSDRIEYFHLKNVDAAVLEVVNQEGVPFAQAVEMGVFCEPALGVVNFEDLAEELRASGFTGHVTVEQDMFPTPPDRPLPIAQRTHDYLASLGLGSS